MSMRNEEQVLFDELRKNNPAVILDGVVDEQEYLSARYKIAYILKEVNGGAGWDLREFVRKEEEYGRPQTWDNIARWTQGILSWEAELPWCELEKDNENRRKTFLRKIAAINLKKTSGGHTANTDEIYLAAEKYSQVIQAQLDIYRPNIVICCGTSGPYIKHCYRGSEPEWKMTTRGIWYFLDGKSVVISYSHPEARTKDSLLYYGLMDAVKEILSDNQL
ncbi:MAG: hypothetical protein LUH56_02655 [Oscillospiraceae bacterium]|nr:hypothetical protein [Oscillospiraceae bacterium]